MHFIIEIVNMVFTPAITTYLLTRRNIASFPARYPLPPTPYLCSKHIRLFQHTLHRLHYISANTQKRTLIPALLSLFPEPICIQSETLPRI